MLSEPSSPDGIEVTSSFGRFISQREAPLNPTLGQPQSMSAQFTQEKNLFHLPEIEPRFLGCQVPSLLTMPTEPSRLQQRCIGLFLILGPKIHGKSNLWKIITALFDIYVGRLQTGNSRILMWRSSNRWAQQHHAVMGSDASSS